MVKPVPGVGFVTDPRGTAGKTSFVKDHIGQVNPVGIVTGGASFALTAPSISASQSIDTRSSTAATSGGSVTLTTTGSTSAGNLSVGNIYTSGTAAAVSSGVGGGAAGNVTLTAAGNSLTVGGTIVARGGAGDGSGASGADGTVKLLATAGAVNQANASGANAINAGKLEVSSNLERLKQEAVFKVVANTWYTLKTRVDVAKDGSGVVLAKIWDRAQPEPAAWTMEVKVPRAHTNGSPGICGVTPLNQKRVYLDHLSVTPNQYYPHGTRPETLF